MDPTLDCIVVGAGFAGLHAASNLVEKGFSVRVLEARDRVGGRVQSADLAGRTVDVGGMWLGGDQPRLAALTEQFQAVTYPTWLGGQAIVSLGGGRIKVPGEQFETAMQPDALDELVALMDDLERIQSDLSPDAPWKHPDAEGLDQKSVRDWAVSRDAQEDVVAFLSVVVRSLFCAELHQVSLLHFASYTMGGGGLDRLLSQAETGAQALVYYDGLHALADRFASSLPAATIRLGSEVAQVDWSVHTDLVTVRTHSDTFFARSVILAVPPGPLQRIRFSPRLPHGKRLLHRRQPMGSVLKCLLAYETPFWREQGLNGTLLLLGDACSPFVDVSPPDGIGIMTGFFEADDAARASAMQPDARRSLVIDCLAASLGEAARHPLDYVEKDWTADIHAEGCYGAYYNPGTLTTYGHHLRQPIGPIHWAGTETATAWSGYVEGALQSGERAASEVAARLVSTPSHSPSSGKTFSLDPS